MYKKVIKPLFFLSFAFCLAFLPPLATFAEEDILSTGESDILDNCSESAIDIWSESKLRRYAEDNILYYDDQFKDSCDHAEEPEPENPCIPSGVDIVIGDNEQSIINSLRATGYSISAIAGIMGNLSIENGEFEPRKLQYGFSLPDNSQDSNNNVPEDFIAYDLNYDGQQGKRWHGQTWEGGLGLAQWTNWSRLKDLQLYAGANNPVTSLATQIGFLIQELTGHAPSNKFQLSPTDINSLNYEQAAIKILDDYEKPDKSQRAKEVENRTKNAKNYYLKLLGQDSEEDPGNSNETPIPSDENCTPSDLDPIPTEIDEGGLTLEQAQRLAVYYGDNKNGSSSSVVSALWDKCNGGGSNCVTFSAFFVNKFTSRKYSGGNGATFSIAGLQPINSPQVYSIFRSSGISNKDGHTGVILGYHNGKYIVGHASCHSQGRNGEIPAADGVYRRFKKDGKDYYSYGSAFAIEETEILPTNWSFPGSKYYNFEFFNLKDYVDVNRLMEYLQNGE